MPGVEGSAEAEADPFYRRLDELFAVDSVFVLDGRDSSSVEDYLAESIL